MGKYRSSGLTAQRQPVRGCDVALGGYAFSGDRSAAPTHDQILVATPDAILEKSGVDHDITVATTQTRASCGIGEVAGKSAAIAAEGRLFHADQTDGVPVIELGVSLTEQIFEILHARVAEEVNAVKQVQRAVCRRDKLVVGKGVSDRPSPPLDFRRRRDILIERVEKEYNTCIAGFE